MLSKVGRQAGYFLRNRGGTPAFFYAWATRDGCRLKSLCETQYLNWTSETRVWGQGWAPDHRGQSRCLLCILPLLPFPELHFLLPRFIATAPPPTSSAPVYTILKESTQRIGSLHNCYLKHINQNAYFISLCGFKQFIWILILIKTNIWGKGTIECQGHVWPVL